jgi:hypothetical protein
MDPYRKPKLSEKLEIKTLIKNSLYSKIEGTRRWGFNFKHGQELELCSKHSWKKVVIVYIKTNLFNNLDLNAKTLNVLTFCMPWGSISSL